MSLREVYDLIKNFAAVDIAEYYLDVSRQRLLLQEGTKEHLSSQMVYSKLLVAFVQACAPILPVTAQDAYQNMHRGILSDDLLPVSIDKSLPPTVFQLHWLKRSVASLPIDPEFLAKYETFETID